MLGKSLSKLKLNSLSSNLANGLSMNNISLFHKVGVSSSQMNTFHKLQKFNFARNTKPFVQIFPGDKVLVMPPWGTQRLTKQAQKTINKFHKEDAKVEYGTVLKVMRKKNQAIVTSVNVKPRYVSPQNYLIHYEAGNLQAIKPKTVNLPVSLDRVRLRDMSFKKELKVLPVKLIRNEAGRLVRVNSKTLKVIKNPLRKRDFTYKTRIRFKRDGPRDTPTELRNIQTYTGENWNDIAKHFIKQIKQKEKIEQKLVLKDK